MRIFLIACLSLSLYSMNSNAALDTTSSRYSECSNLKLQPDQHKANLRVSCTGTSATNEGENAIEGFIDNKVKAPKLSFNYIKRNGDVGTIDLYDSKFPVVTYASDPMGSEEVRQLLIAKKLQPSDIAGIALQVVAFDPKPKIYQDPDAKFVQNPTKGGNPDREFGCDWHNGEYQIIKANNCGTLLCQGIVDCGVLSSNIAVTARAKDGVCDATFSVNDPYVHMYDPKPNNNTGNAAYHINDSTTSPSAE